MKIQTCPIDCTFKYWPRFVSVHALFSCVFLLSFPGYSKSFKKRARVGIKASKFLQLFTITKKTITYMFVFVRTRTFVS